MLHLNVGFRLAFLASLVSLAAATVCNAIVIPVGTGDANVVGSSPPEVGCCGSRDEDNVVNGSGLALVAGKLTVTTGQPNNNNWNTTTSTANITFDLGSKQHIGFIQIWNFSDSFGNNDFGASAIELQVSDIGTNALTADFSSSPIIAILPIAEATGSLAYLGENYRFSGQSAASIPSELGGTLHDFSSIDLSGRFVRFANLDGSLSFGGRTGLSEVRFFTVVIPEPATATLGLLAFGGLMLRRRRMA